MFHLKGGLILALYPRSELAKDARHTMGVQSPTEFSLGYLAASKDEVDQILVQAKTAGPRSPILVMIGHGASIRDILRTLTATYGKLFGVAPRRK